MQTVDQQWQFGHLYDALAFGAAASKALGVVEVTVPTQLQQGDWVLTVKRNNGEVA